jgi:hypothetical protein
MPFPFLGPNQLPETLLDFQGKLNLPVSQFPIGSATITYRLFKVSVEILNNSHKIILFLSNSVIRAWSSFSSKSEIVIAVMTFSIFSFSPFWSRSRTEFVWKCCSVCDFEDFNFFDLESLRTRKKRLPIQFGVVGVTQTNPQRMRPIWNHI